MLDARTTTLIQPRCDALHGFRLAHHLDEVGKPWRASRRPSLTSRPRMAVLAKAIRARRKALKLTQIDLSRLAGCGPDFVYDVEAGKPSLRLDKLLDVLAVLGLELVVGQGKSVLRVAPELVPRVAR